MKHIRNFLAMMVITAAIYPAQAQNVGLSFSYFIPKNGYFSTPISPFSIRGLGFDLNRFIAIETGASLYRMSGLAMKDMPIESKSPFTGPNFTLFVPVELFFQLQGDGVQFDIKGGVFGFHAFDQHLNYGNIDRAIRDFEGWQVANSSLSFSNKPGWGYHAGAELTVYVTSQVGVSIECNYLVGESQLPLKGSYTGGGPGALETVIVDDLFHEAKVDFTGLEFSIGLIFETGGPSKPKKPRRRR
jgi:hypothetical protein